MSVLRIITVFAALVAQVFNWTAFCTSVWGKMYDSVFGDSYRSVGLWVSCPSDLVTQCYSYVGTTLGFHVAIQAMACLGFVGVNFTFVAAILRMSAAKDWRSQFHLSNGAVALLSAFFWMVAVAVFGASYRRDGRLMNGVGRLGEIGFSFWMAVMTMLVEIVLAVLFMVGKKMGGSVSVNEPRNRTGVDVSITEVDGV
ncbi:uncharacterized protein [Haliotis cracherodii]|uniref:uncharacterized protein n=1 Tax=Haliotis cracherodii TaxID=6455 RepID=UPI0039E8A8F4